MSEIVHRLSNHDVSTIGKFEAALRKEFDLRVVFRIDHQKEHCTNDANLRDICNALSDPNLTNPARVRSLFAEKVHYMKYPRGTVGVGGRAPKDMFAHPERSQVVVVSMPKKKDSVSQKADDPAAPLSAALVSKFEKDHNLSEILAGMGVGKLPDGQKLDPVGRGEVIERYLTTELTGQPGTGKLHALLKHLSADPDSILVVWSGFLMAVESTARGMDIEDKLAGRVITEARFKKALVDHDYRTREDVVAFMQAKHVFGYGLATTNTPSVGRTKFFQNLFDRRGFDQKIILVN